MQQYYQYYEKKVSADGRTPRRSAAPVVVPKAESIEPRFSFDYHFVYEEPLGSIIELADRGQGLMGSPRHKVARSDGRIFHYAATQTSPCPKRQIPDARSCSGQWHCQIET